MGGGGGRWGGMGGLLVESLFMKWKQRLLMLRRRQIECFSLRAFYGADLLGCLVCLGAGMTGKGVQGEPTNIYLRWLALIYIYMLESGGNKLLWKREAEHRPGTCPGK